MKNWSKFSFFIVALLWGSSFAFQKTLLDVISPFTLTFWNFAIAGLVFLGIAFYRKSRLFYRLREGMTLGVLLAGVEIFQMLGLRFSSSADTVFISNLGMLLIPYGGWLLFRDKVSLKNNVALLLAIAGMYLLVGGVHGFGFGQLMLLVSAVAMALYFLYSERFEGERNSHAIVLLVQQFFVTTLLSGLVVLFFGESLRVPSFMVGDVLLQVLFFVIVPYALVQWASRWADEMTSAVYDGVVEPLVGGITSWVFFAEATTRLSVIGALLMVTAFSVVSIFSNRHFLNKGIKVLDALVR